MLFYAWEKMLIEEGYPNTDESRLALNTLRICLSDIQVDKATEDIDEDTFKITENGYALFDYAMFCYFLFRARLCSDFTHDFIERYDAFTQKLLSLYFDCNFDIPQETINRLIISRAKEYDEIAASQNSKTIQEILEALISFMEKDFAGTPECREIVITGFSSRYWLITKVRSYSKITLDALEREAELILHRESKSPFTPEPISHSPKEKKSSSTIDCASSNEPYSLKEKLINSLGSIGVVLFFLARLIIAVLPFVMIGANFFVTLLLIAINTFVPFASVVFWIWGLVCAIKGVQDFWAILYYVAFVVIWLPFFISTLLSVFSKKQ